jgi:hypothetical protein
MFQPVLPLGGFAGWRFLERTLETQKAAFNESATLVRAVDHFRENISNIKTAEDLVADRQLLSVALGAFGLDDDINNKFFIQKILSDGTTADGALSSRLADKSYASLSAAFGFGDPTGPRVGLTNFADQIIARYENKQFEISVGDQNSDLRLALGLESSLSDVTSQSKSQNAQWFSMMGSPPLRRVFETALGLPASIARIDLDQQLSTFKNRALFVFGTDNISDFTAPEKREDLLRMFLIRSEAQFSSGISSGNIALTLLRS